MGTVANAALQPSTATIKAGEKYTVTCGSDGNLTPASITCKAEEKTCKKPTVANAALQPTTATIKAGEKYTVTCASGHILEGQVNTFTCGSDGNLSPASITCKATDQEKTCAKPTIAHASLTPDSATVKEGEKYTVKCSKGYKL